MTKALGLRQYRACVRCRSRKTRCDLQSIGERGKPPCAKCIREGVECVLAGSRRGGDFSHFRRSRRVKEKEQDEAALSVSSSDHVSPRMPCKGEQAIHGNLQNPSDALLILAHAAGQPDHFVEPSPTTTSASTGHGGDDGFHSSRLSGLQASSPTGLDSSFAFPFQDPAVPQYSDISAFPPVKDGTLDTETLFELLRQYAQYYHPFLPIVPACVLQEECIPDTIKDESFLLTAMLVVASKNRTDLTQLHESLWDYMKRLILDVVLGMASIRKVGCVEGLLLLGEWTVLNQGQADGGGEEASWSILGLAVRLAYLLRLEDSSFKGASDEENDANLQRARLAWTFTYLADRQISIRMGQAFWCRGPALSARFTAQDFPALQPKHASDEDFASLVQAQVELTALFGSAHDILFASRSRTAELMMRGDYNRYIDDARRAMDAWQSAWKGLSVSPHLRSCLTLMYEYLRLYVNAFAFQAVLYRASKGRDSSSGSSDELKSTEVFPDSPMASPDARNIYQAIEAAEMLLRIAIEDIDPEKHLRYMPARFYLYEIHSSVFLYKAHVAGAISSEMHAQTTSMMRNFISVLTAAAVDDTHIAARYAKLLDKLWFGRTDGPSAGSSFHAGGVTMQYTNGEVNDPLVMVEPDMNGNQMSLFGDVGSQLFDFMDMDCLFSYSQPCFLRDQPGFVGY